MSVATDTLVQLELAKVRLQRSQPAGAHPRAAHTAIETAASAFRTLSSVLVCPCSESHDVGLVAAAACFAMLDVYSAIIGRSKARSADQRLVPPPASDSSCMLLSMEDELLYWELSNPASSSSDSAREDATMVRVLGELTEVARVVLQFTKRYWDADGEKHSPDFLKALARMLTLYLKSVTVNAVVNK
jgi:hypothetical protein